MTDILGTISTRRTPQGERADARQVVNSAGGFTFEVDDLARLRRFLVLGVDGGTYYAGAGELARENAGVVFRLVESDPVGLIRTIVEVSREGRAPRANPALFALAIAAGAQDTELRTAALRALPVVARTGTHLLTFVGYVEQFRGWGRGLRRGVSAWYTGKDADALAYQVVKYRQRGGWSHRDVLRLAHPSADALSVRAVFEWIVDGVDGPHTPRIIEGFMKANEPGANVAQVVRDYRLTWDMLPTAALNEVAVWDALLDVGVPQTALMRQLPRLTRLGMLPQMGGRTVEVGTQLADSDRLKRARVHPVNVLVAGKTYAQGYGRGGEWAPTRQIVNALDAAFYAAFGAVEPANKRTMIGLDVSGSMGYCQIANMPLSPREASAALSLVQVATEPEVAVYGFTGNGTLREGSITPLGISPRQRMRDVIRDVSNLPFGPTDCSLPMVHALEEGMEVDTFVIYTDNETWHGKMHPNQALRTYREQTGIDARLVVVAMTPTSFSIADPSDAGMLDIAGFDSATPNLISTFSRGV